MNIENNNPDGMEEENNFFDQPVNIGDDFSDGKIEYDAKFLEGYASDENDFQSREDDEDLTGEDDIDFEDDIVPSERKKEQGENSKPVEDIDFEDEKATKEDDDVFKEEEALEKLRALGYDIPKKEENDPIKMQTRQIENLDKVIANINSIIDQNDLELCRQKNYQDLATEYRKSGRESEIDSSEFKEEVDLKMEEYTYNPKLQSLEARQIRADLKEYAKEKQTEKSAISQEVEKKQSEEIKENRIGLQNAFKNYNGKTLFGQKFSQEDIKSAYKKVTSGDYAKTINSDKSIQAEFALYLEKRESILNSKGATYGEGVADAVNALNGKKENVTKSSLDKVVSRSSSGNTLKDRYESWGDRTAVAR